MVPVPILLNDNYGEGEEDGKSNHGCQRKCGSVSSAATNSSSNDGLNAYEEVETLSTGSFLWTESAFSTENNTYDSLVLTEEEESASCEILHQRYVIYNASKTLPNEENVFYALDSQAKQNSSNDVVVKLKPGKGGLCQLQHELKIYKKLADAIFKNQEEEIQVLLSKYNIGFSTLLQSNLNSYKWDPWKYLVLTNDGESLERIHETLKDPVTGLKRGFNYIELCHMEIQAIELLQIFHGIGLIHRDIHPGNFLRNNETLKLIDFLATEELNVEGMNDETTPSKGSFRSYCSAKHEHRKYTRFDDLEALGLMLVDLAGEKLPWKKNSFKLNFKTREAMAGEMANYRMSKKLKKTCKTFPDIFYKFILYARSGNGTGIFPKYESWKRKFGVEEKNQIKIHG